MVGADLLDHHDVECAGGLELSDDLVNQHVVEGGAVRQDVVAEATSVGCFLQERRDLADSLFEFIKIVCTIFTYYSILRGESVQSGNGGKELAEFDIAGCCRGYDIGERRGCGRGLEWQRNSRHNRYRRGMGGVGGNGRVCEL